ncbi:prolipoprotein diacylglyceryl transferase [Aliikangiella coralliicola]|uniref:Prolipoprotein diacylglyceryl transferase n=1 Tax=Aliikangiella coralliicola TaxID=2592383 RepID=A0A545UEL3_9GAMM|nr:prolipoprotein diacylglyceryl transferase family protein [Aliikangiella coralliicola]TQV87875.1 prolipoprotein diacylglyceryl transferase [Aliikangiella coralliicola]
MYPYLYQSNTLTIGTYGVMLALAYLIGRHMYIVRINEVSKRPINTEILIISLLIFGVIGAKLMFMVKNPHEADFSDWSSLLSGSGFSSQGAIVAAILVTVLFSQLSKIKLSLLLDAAAPAAAFAYAIARIGCFLAGDDCYGVKSELPWAMSFPHGVAATNDKVHPVPLYEALYSLVIWYSLKKYQLKKPKPYFVFFTLLLTWGVCRFLVEFISTNPVKVLGMSGSQFGALLMLLSACTFFAVSYFQTGKKKPG